jgi:hypothetical protein
MSIDRYNAHFAKPMGKIQEFNAYQGLTNQTKNKRERPWRDSSSSTLLLWEA